jgi:2-polyprenyl-3-methyl-5-hydroxy-6-metoxy-1,4-benzoquinol methylase
MKRPDFSKIDQPWPETELENVDSCPYCKSTERSIAYKDVQDWSFYGASGKWSYWNCLSCEALYLNPRPKEASIGKAYATYYTHSAGGTSLRQSIKTRLKNECFYHWRQAEISPRLNVPVHLGFIFTPLKKFIHLPFELEHLIKKPKGKLLDVGCGSGSSLLVAKQLGWDVTGLEIDPSAVKAARELGLNIVEGDFRQLKQFENQFDCIICSHVLEHVHFPLELLGMLTQALRPQGLLLLSLPNAKSHVREEFGADWRGLEAPRHIGIPSLQKLTELLKNLEYEDIHQTHVNNLTVVESIRIRNRRLTSSFLTKLFAKIKITLSTTAANAQSDFIQISAKKRS